MMLTERVARAVAAGEVGVAYRRWKRARVTAGATFRTVAGIVRIDSIDAVDAARLTAADARAAGAASLDELTSTFRGDEHDPVFRIALVWVGPDERVDVASDARLSVDDIAQLDALLDRLDARAPWARTTLARIGAEPGVTARALAADLPIEMAALKRRIRTLKEHGLTRSLRVGYELSERGRAYLDASG